MKSTLKSTAGRSKSLSVETIEPIVAAKLIESGKATGPMVVDGCLDLSGKLSLKKLPAGISCYELDLSNTSITELPDDLHVESSLILRDCKQLVKLPDGLTTGTLDLPRLSTTRCLASRFECLVS